MVDISSQNNKINVTVSSSGNTANTNITPDYAQYYSEKSKEWAISNKIVDNTDYSSKYYANESKKQADISTAKTTEVIESGNNAVSSIDSARDNAIIDITNQENLSVDNVNTAGATQIANVNSAGTTQINLAKEQVALATNQANIATEQATIATNKTSEVVASGNEALSNIATAKSEALTEIETLHSSSVTDITDLKNTSIADITTAKDNAITSITNQETTSKNNVIATGNEQVARIEATGNNYDNLTHRNITNCLLEVPQRIKYTLENGTLTIKAGSVVIVPYGVEDLTAQYPKGATFIKSYFKVYDTQFVDGKFFVWAELTEDKTLPITTSSGAYTKAPVSLNFSSNTESSVFGWSNKHASGTETGTVASTLYYQTNNNTYLWENTGTEYMSFPLLQISHTANSGIVTIDQVFNGMGYIGSTVWVDKGVKGLIPNGRNADGSLRNIEVTVDRVQVTTNTISDQPNTFGIRSNGLILQYTYLGEYAVPPTAGGAWGLYYNTQEQTFYFNNHGTWKKYQVSLCGKVTYNSSLTITSFQPKLPFRAVDYNDIDGIWNGQGTVLTQNTACSSSTKTSFDLSNYLPKDGNNYEVLNDSSLEIPKGQVGKLIREIIYTSIQNDFYLVGVSSDYNNYPSSSVGNAHCAVGPDRKLNVKFTGSTGTGTYSLYARGYRKIR